MEELERYHIHEYRSDSPSPSWYEPNYGPDDDREEADFEETVQFFLSHIIDKVGIDDYMLTLAEEIAQNGEVWFEYDHKKLLTDPRVVTGLKNSKGVKEYISDWNMIFDDLLSEELSYDAFEKQFEYESEKYWERINEPPDDW